MTLLSVYAPTLTSDESSKDRFYDNLRSTFRTVPPQDKVALLGDFNARVGTNHHIWNGVIGKHGVGNVNSNGLRLLNLCSEFDLIISHHQHFISATKSTQDHLDAPEIKALAPTRLRHSTAL